MHRFIFEQTSWALVLAFGIVCCSVVAQADEGTIDFRRDIFPILSNTCFNCHGPDQNSRRGGFRLDDAQSAFGAAKSGKTPIVPGDSAASELLRRIHADDKTRMPPADQPRQLSDREKALLKRWIEEGAVFNRHWAFVTPTRPAVPAVTESDWPSNPIDHFVLVKMQSHGLQPRTEAEFATLIRRVALDVTGLPPTMEELDRFLNTADPDRYDQLVDYFLQKPAYGEQMAVHWLDAARFADTNGYQNDFKRNMWPWRDWVINAFNSNKPFDEFTIEQIAGDMLENPTLQQKIATGFNRNHRTVTEGGSIEEEWHVENVVDRVETTSTVFLGLTTGCARCHDHKYDPISQREFYQFFAYFNSVNEKGFHNERRGNVPPLVKVPPADYESTLERLDDDIEQCRESLRQVDERMAPQRESWLAALTDRDLDSPEAAVHSPSQPTADIHEDRFVDSPFDVSIQFSKDKSHVNVETDFQFEHKKSFSTSAWIRPTGQGALISRMDAASDYRGFDTAIRDDGRLNIHLIHLWPQDSIKIITDQKVPMEEWSHLAVTYDGSRKATGFHVYLNGRLLTHQAERDSLEGPTTIDHPFWLGERTDSPKYDGQLADLRVFSVALTPDQVRHQMHRPLTDIARLDAASRTEAQSEVVRAGFVREFNDEFGPVKNRLEEAIAAKKEYEKNVPTTMIMEERDEPRKTYVLNRGLYDQPDLEQQVTPAVPAFLPQPDDAEQNRLTLARWMVSPENPLTARVFVNRIWEQIFGVGIVESSENFGRQAPLPSHPELLDWLAVEFVESGWDIKALQKLILTSATYRQSSAAPAEHFRQDPHNRLLARAPRFRLGAESIRDNALAIGGLLVKDVGGPSIKPYQPENLWDELAGGAGEGKYVQDTDDNLYRRSLYIYRKRTVPHPTMTTFDAGSREICQVARSRTNTPLQALALLNDTTYVEAARGLALRSLSASQQLDGQISAAFRAATCRLPSEQEIQILKDSHAAFLANYEQDPAATKEWLDVGELKNNESIEPAKLAAMTAVANVILNLDETITKE